MHFAINWSQQLCDPVDKEGVMGLLAAVPKFNYDLITMQGSDFIERPGECEKCHNPFHGVTGDRSVGVVQFRAGGSLCSDCFTRDETDDRADGLIH